MGVLHAPGRSLIHNAVAEPADSDTTFVALDFAAVAQFAARPARANEAATLVLVAVEGLLHRKPRFVLGFHLRFQLLEPRLQLRRPVHRKAHRGTTPPCPLRRYYWWGRSVPLSPHGPVAA